MKGFGKTLGPAPAGKRTPMSWSSRSGRRAFTMLVLVVMAVATMVLLPGAGAVSTPINALGLFELDAPNADTVDAPAVPGEDWNDVYDCVVTPAHCASYNFFSHTFIGANVEAPANDVTYWKGGGSKDTNDISQWAYAPTDVAPDKNDITDAYGASYINPANGHTIVYFGMDRFDTAGDANVGFWFLRDPSFGLNGSGGFNGLHEDGDLFVVSAFTGGGVVPTVDVYEWLSGSLHKLSTGTPCAGDTACAAVNGVSAINVPWAYQDKAGDAAGSVPSTGFFEGGLDLNTLFGAATSSDLPCFSNFLAETRSSQETNAQLKDLAVGQLNSCGSITITKTASPTDASASFPFSASGADAKVSDFSLTGSNAGDATNVKTFESVKPGSYTVAEGSLPDHWGFGSLSCTSDGGSSWTANVQIAKEADITLGPGGNVSCVFTNNRLKETPTLTTNATASAVVGHDLTDTATLDGGFNPTGTILFSLYGPNDPGCDSTPVFTSSKDVSGDGDVTSAAYTPTAIGDYHWAATYSGDGFNNQVIEACGGDNEASSVGPDTPGITTNASADVVVGHDLTDVAHLTGGYNPVGTITFTLYGPNDTGCENDPVFTSDPVTVNGDGNYTSGAYTALAAGPYNWVASFTSGDTNNNDVSGNCSDANESVNVDTAHPAISTELSSGEITVGDSVNDSATIQDATGDAGGQVTYTVYDNSNCSSTEGDPGQVVSTVDVTDGNVPNSDSFEFDTAGDFYWQASYTGDDNNAAATSPCESEHLIVDKATPTLSTTASDNVVLGGDPLTDVAHFDGGFNDPQGDMTFTLYGPNDPNCTGDPVFTDAQLGEVDGPGNYTSGSFTPTAAGTYNWVVTYTSTDNNNNSVTEACGSETESTTVSNPSISIAKDPNSQTIGSGGTATFTITVTNTGDVVLNDVSVTDAQAPGCARADLGSLQPAGSESGTSTSYSCTLANVTKSFTNSATATGNPDVGPPVTATDTADVTVTTTPPPPPPVVPPVVVVPPVPVIDLQVTKADSPDPDVLGNKLRYTITVKNNGPDTAHNVQMSDPLPVGVSFSSVSTNQGTCTGGQLISCQLGTIDNGQSVVITVLVKTLQTGIITNTATTVGQEAESNVANNTATTTTLVKGPFTPPAVVPTGCYAVAVTPHSLTAGKRQTLTLSVHMLGKPAKNARVRVTGAGISKTSGPTNAKGIVRISVKPAKPGILRFQPVAHKGCAVPRIGVIGAFTPPVTG